MKTNLLDELEEEARAQISEARQLRETPIAATHLEERFRRCKVAMGIIQSFVRLKATLANEETNRLVGIKLEHELGGPNAFQKKVRSRSISKGDLTSST